MGSDYEITLIENNRKDTMICKWKPSGQSIGFQNYVFQKNTIVCVDNGTIAIAYLKNGRQEFQEYFPGPCRENLFSEKYLKTLSFSTRIRGLIESSAVEIIFFKYSDINRLEFGVPYFKVRNSVYPGRETNVAVRGEIRFSVPEHLSFIARYDIRNFNYDDFRKRIRRIINEEIRKNVQKMTSSPNMSISVLEYNKSLLEGAVKDNLDYLLYKELGITLEKIEISSIETC